MTTRTIKGVDVRKLSHRGRWQQVAVICHEQACAARPSFIIKPVRNICVRRFACRSHVDGAQRVFAH